MLRRRTLGSTSRWSMYAGRLAVSDLNAMDDGAARARLPKAISSRTRGPNGWRGETDHPGECPPPEDAPSVRRRRENPRVATVSGLLGDVVSLLARLVPSRASRAGYVRALLDVYGALPDTSTSKDHLLDHIDRLVLSFVQDNDEKRRDPLGIVLALIFLAGSVGLAYLAWTRDSWTWAYWTGAAVTFLFGAVGLSQDAVRRPRDERGHALD